jgi:hypothetical protein
VFSTALQQVEKYTLPVIFSQRLASGAIGSGCGSFIVLNKDGWILTAAHVAQTISAIQKDKAEFDAYRQKCEVIAKAAHLNDKAKRKMIKALPRNNKWVINQAALWGFAGSGIEDFHVDLLADLAIGKLEPFDADWVASYPIFKNPSEPMPVGTSLCRLGYPFHRIEATFDESKGTFALAPGVLPIPRFPNDGIHTRIAVVVSSDGSRQVKFLETSTPGLMGQSGGPIFDRNGHVWAMQCKTQSLSLGFAPEVIVEGKKTVEHQFMHVGWGSHVENILEMLRGIGIKVATSS